MTTTDGDLGRELVRLDNKKRALAEELKDVKSSITRLNVKQKQLESSIADVETQSRGAIRQYAEGNTEACRMMATPSSVEQTTEQTVESEAQPTAPTTDTAPSLLIKINVPRQAQQDTTPVAQAMLNRSPDDAAGVRVHSGPNIIHESFPTVVLLSGLWYDISCRVCGANCPPIRATFFRGIHGLRIHWSKAHYKGVPIPKDAITKCNLRLVTPGDVKLMLRGLQPQDFAIVRTQPQDESSSDAPTMSDTEITSAEDPRPADPSRTDVPQNTVQEEHDETVKPEPGVEKQIIHPNWPNVVFLDGHWTELSCSECGANSSVHDRKFMSIVGFRNHFRIHGHTALTSESFSKRLVSPLDGYLMQHGNHPLDQTIERVCVSPRPAKRARDSSPLHRSSSPEGGSRPTEYEIYQNLTAEARASGTPRVKTRNKQRKSWAAICNEDYSPE